MVFRAFFLCLETGTGEFSELGGREVMQAVASPKC